MQVLELFQGEVDGILSFFNGQKHISNFLVRLRVKAKLAVLTRFFCEKNQPVANPGEKYTVSLTD